MGLADYRTVTAKGDIVPYTTWAQKARAKKLIEETAKKLGTKGPRMLKGVGKTQMGRLLGQSGAALAPAINLGGALATGWGVGRTLGGTPLITAPDTTYDQFYQEAMVPPMERYYGRKYGTEAQERASEDGSQIDMEKIKMIESSGNPKAYNKTSQARGLYQITPIALEEWNDYHKKEQYTDNELFNAKINTKIANWYMKKRIPQLLKHYKLPDTIENRIKAYNWGIGAMQSGEPVPEETLNYIKKYRGE